MLIIILKNLRYSLFKILKHEKLISTTTKFLSLK